MSSSLLLLLSGRKKYLYDFSEGSLPAGAAFLRSTTGTYYDNSGVMQSAAINTPRFDYNPATLVLRGLLIEPQRTNYIFPSSANAGGTGGSLSSIAGTGPDGGSTFRKFTEDTATSRHYSFAWNANSNTAATTWAFSAFGKAGTEQIVQIASSSGAGRWFSVMPFTNVNLSTATVTRSATNIISNGIQNISNGWKRIWHTVVADQTSTYSESMVFSLTGNNASADGYPTYTGTSNYALEFGLQAEKGGTVTSYIPTTSAAVTRAADVLTLDVPSGVTALRFTFDDNSTQDVDVSAYAGSTYEVPTTLNRPHIKYVGAA